MEHTVQGYLKRQSLGVIMCLLRDAVDKNDKEMVYIILDALEERLRQQKML